MLGNSSSGIIEAPYFNIPVINIGRRQYGRDCSLNILNSKYTFEDISSQINYAVSKKFKNKMKKNKAIYYQKDTVEKIYKKISNLTIKKNLSKKFRDI